MIYMNLVIKMVKIKEIESSDLSMLVDMVYNLKENYFGVTNQSNLDSAINLLLSSIDEFSD